MATFLHFSHPFLSFMLHCDTHCPSRVLQMRGPDLCQRHRGHTELALWPRGGLP
jgi:hypothetical protein|eukprot:COSAG06_NODE_2855_length_6169_cov_7.820264_5_plen_54_part_00